MDSLSIHPRNHKDGNKQIKNTARPYKGKSTRFAKIQRCLNLRQNACNATRKETKGNPEAFRMPGSMKGH